MLVDIHSHKLSNTDNCVVYNIPVIKAEAMFNSHTKGWFSLGFHPCYIEDFSTERFELMKDWVRDKRLAAIGECGLDKNSKTPLEKQIEIFEKQVMLSEESRKPVIIHCVGYFNELLALKKKWEPKQSWIIHGFRGKPQLGEQILKCECSLSFGEYFNPDSVCITPVENLFVETDESSMPLIDIYQKIAEIKRCRIQELNAGEILLNNSRSMN